MVSASRFADLRPSDARAREGRLGSYRGEKLDGFCVVEAILYDQRGGRIAVL